MYVQKLEDRSLLRQVYCLLQGLIIMEGKLSKKTILYTQVVYMKVHLMLTLNMKDKLVIDSYCSLASRQKYKLLVIAYLNLFEPLECLNLSVSQTVWKIKFLLYFNLLKINSPFVWFRKNCLKVCRISSSFCLFSAGQSITRFPRF